MPTSARRFDDDKDFFDWLNDDKPVEAAQQAAPTSAPQRSAPQRTAPKAAPVRIDSPIRHRARPIPPPYVGFHSGDRVVAHSLTGMPELNGMEGIVKGHQGAAHREGRVGVVFPEPFGAKALRPANLRHIDGTAPAPPDSVTADAGGTNHNTSNAPVAVPAVQCSEAPNQQDIAPTPMPPSEQPQREDTVETNADSDAAMFMPGDSVRVLSDATQVERLCRLTGSVPWAKSKARFCGRNAEVVCSDLRDGTVQLRFAHPTRDTECGAVCWFAATALAPIAAPAA